MDKKEIDKLKIEVFDLREYLQEKMEDCRKIEQQIKEKVQIIRQYTIKKLDNFE